MYTNRLILNEIKNKLKKLKEEGWVEYLSPEMETKTQTKL